MQQQTTSIVDDQVQDWLTFGQPVYVMNGDVLRVNSDRGEIVWNVFKAMVLVGCRLDGWPIEVQNGVYFSVQFDSVARQDTRL